MKTKLLGISPHSEATKWVLWSTLVKLNISVVIENGKAGDSRISATILNLKFTQTTHTPHNKCTCSAEDARAYVQLRTHVRMFS
jgi:hypothetical protein